MQVSPDTKRLAYAVDTGGGERYDIQVRDLATGKDLLQKPIPVSRPWLSVLCICVRLPSVSGMSAPMQLCLAEPAGC